jgi:hypothetical protein
MGIQEELTWTVPHPDLTPFIICFQNVFTNQIPLSLREVI